MTAGVPIEKPKVETTIAIRTKPNVKPKPRNLDELFETVFSPEQFDYFINEFEKALRRSLDY